MFFITHLSSLEHFVKPECMHDYTQLISEYYPKLAAMDPENMKLSGSWLTILGEQDSAVHIWEFTGYTGHQIIYDKLMQDPEYTQYCRKLMPMLRSRSNQICLEFAFWATSPPRNHGGIFELRSYSLKPGRMLEWETNWRKGLEYRRQFCEPVGAWFAQLGRLNQVHHMWQYPDLEARKRTREAAWQTDGWAQTVYNTVRLINEMDAQILQPFPFSPLK